MVTWKIINEDYTDFLRDNYEKRIPETDYGSDKLKPFFGELFRVGDLVYVTQVTSPKPSLINLKQSIDFYKIYQNKKLISCVNLNYMFPVPISELNNMDYKDIDNYVNFKDEQAKSKYIQLLKYELSIINTLNLETSAMDLYRRKYDKPQDKVSLRCFDFKNLEIGAKEWETNKLKKSNEALVGSAS
jgi:protein AbiQ